MKRNKREIKPNMKNIKQDNREIKSHRFTRNSFIEKYKEELTIQMISDLISKKCKNGCINNDRCSDCDKEEI